MLDADFLLGEREREREGEREVKAGGRKERTVKEMEMEPKSETRSCTHT